MIYRISVAALAALLSFYAIWIEPTWIKVNIYEMRSNETQDAIRVVQLSDLHIQEVGKRELAVLDQVKLLTPDLLVLSGDVIDKADRLPELHTFLTALNGIPAIAVLGNWEYWSGVDLAALREEYIDHGIRLLVNEVTTYKVRQRNIDLIGVDDFTGGNPDYDLLTHSIEGHTGILITHSPEYFDEALNYQNSNHLDLCLAGHTHGGQVTLFGWPIWMPPGSGSYASGIYNTETCELYISKGIGNSILPIRFGARPEIAVFEL
jgi:predicted MPP superfamily phosphohydrolase